LLDDELASMIEVQQGEPFGRDLAAASGLPDSAARSAAS
jgi:hypothetical protein